MKNKIYKLSNHFWNIRGSFKLNGIIEIGTQCSLVKINENEFILLDCIEFDDKTLNEILEITNDGTLLKSIINLHPFHTVYAPKMDKYFPRAKYYGTSRHKKMFKNIKWQTKNSESFIENNPFSKHLDFSIPQGVDFISKNENIHFSSILAYHYESKTLHVDDTLIYIKLPKLIRIFGPKEYLGFHPTLSKALIKDKNSSQEFSDWAKDIALKWSDAKNICAAHSNSKINNDKSFSFKEVIFKALSKQDATLKKHEEKFT